MLFRVMTMTLVFVMQWKIKSKATRWNKKFAFISVVVQYSVHENKHWQPKWEKMAILLLSWWACSKNYKLDKELQAQKKLCSVVKMEMWLSFLRRWWLWVFDLNRLSAQLPRILLLRPSKKCNLCCVHCTYPFF